MIPPSRKPIITGNWKLNLNIADSIRLVTQLKRDLSGVDYAEIVVCPVYTALVVVQDVLMETNISLGAQDLYWEDAGAFTGEVSAPLLRDIGVQYVIIGHSERRQYFGENNVCVRKKINAALQHDLTPIVCVGEVLEQRESGRTFEVVEQQCAECFNDFPDDEIRKVVIAYEPVWAIGTGRTATPLQAQEVHRFIRDYLGKIYGEETADALRLQYGGSVKPENITELMAQPDIDGALVGGASLKSDSFAAIVRNCCNSPPSMGGVRGG